MSSINREELKKEFLASNGHKNYKISAFPQDASKRSYSRIYKDNNKTFVLMDAPPEHEDIKPFLKITKLLRSMNLRAPEIHAYDETHGFILLEDLGDDSYTKFLIRNPNKEYDIYKSAIDVLIHIYKNFPKDCDIAPYSLDFFIKEAKIFADYTISVNIKDPIKLKDYNDEYLELIKDLYNLLLTNKTGTTLVLRDYHADNLQVLDNSHGINSVGLLDYQDALIGSTTYDIMSLMEDARRDVSEHTVHNLILYFVKEIGMEYQEFMHDYYIWAAQRNLKIIGIFNRKLYLEGNDNYQKFIPRVWDYLNGDVNHPHLNKIKNFLAKCT